MVLRSEQAKRELQISTEDHNNISNHQNSKFPRFEKLDANNDQNHAILAPRKASLLFQHVDKVCQENQNLEYSENVQNFTANAVQNSSSSFLSSSSSMTDSSTAESVSDSASNSEKSIKNDIDLSIKNVAENQNVNSCTEKVDQENHLAPKFVKLSPRPSTGAASDSSRNTARNSFPNFNFSQRFSNYFPI